MDGLLDLLDPSSYTALFDSSQLPHHPDPANLDDMILGEGEERNNSHALGDIGRSKHADGASTRPATEIATAVYNIYVG